MTNHVHGAGCGEVPLGDVLLARRSQGERWLTDLAQNSRCPEVLTVLARRYMAPPEDNPLPPRAQQALRDRVRAGETGTPIASFVRLRTMGIEHPPQ